MSRYTASLSAPGDFGVVIQQARLEKGLTQAQLAAELGVPQSTISEIEGGRSTILLRRLLALAELTGVEFKAAWGSDDATLS